MLACVCAVSVPDAPASATIASRTATAVIVQLAKPGSDVNKGLAPSNIYCTAQPGLCARHDLTSQLTTVASLWHRRGHQRDETDHRCHHAGRSAWSGARDALSHRLPQREQDRHQPRDARVFHHDQCAARRVHRQCLSPLFLISVRAATLPAPPTVTVTPTESGALVDFRPANTGTFARASRESAFSFAALSSSGLQPFSFTVVVNGTTSLTVPQSRNGGSPFLVYGLIPGTQVPQLASRCAILTLVRLSVLHFGEADYCCWHQRFLCASDGHASASA